MEICPKCGLPKQACVCDQIAKSSQKIQVTTDKKRYGKIVTIVKGFDKGVDLKDVAKNLKSKLACGGTYKKNQIELQGDHVDQIKPLLVKIGFEEDMVE
jgi:translation initiation factor 1